MKNNFFWYIFIFIIVFFISFLYKVFVMPVTGDEIWVYGFSYNITRGLMIYRDFNVVLTPFYFFLGSLFIFLFGNYLISLHIFDCILLSILMILIYKRLGIYKSLLIFPIILFNYFPTYSYFCLFLLFVILYLLDKKKEVSFLVISFLLGLILITKQSIGLLMVIPVLIYSKSRLRDLFFFFLPFILVVVYLSFNHALFDFINYCFLGMFDFGKSNLEFSIFSICEFILLGYLIYKLIKTNFKDRKILFILMFQINVYPIFDAQHFLEVLIPVVYLFLYDFNVLKLRLYYRFLLVISLYIIFIFYILKCVLFLDYSVSFNKDNYLYLRNNSVGVEILEKETRFIEEYFDRYEEMFFLFLNNYAFKLYSKMPIGQYDLLMDGNLGYNGERRVIREIDDICKKKTCVFFINKQNFGKYNQFSREIYDYVLKNYSKVDSSEPVFVYDNKKILN